MFKKTLHLTFALSIFICFSGCNSSNKKKEREEPQPVYTSTKPQGKTMEEVYQELREQVSKRLDEYIGNNSPSMKYDVVGEFYQDFNNDGKTDYVCIFEFKRNGQYLNGSWQEDISYGIGYSISNMRDKGRMETYIAYDVIPSVNEISETYGDKEKFAYSLVSADCPQKNSFRLRFTDYFSRHFGKETTELYRDENLKSFWMELTFEYEDDYRTFELTKCEGLNLYGKGKQSIDFKKSSYDIIHLSYWPGWYMPLRLCSAEEPAKKKKTVYVKNEEEFAKAIGSNTEIIIQTDILNLTAIPTSLDSLENLSIIGEEYEDGISCTTIIVDGVYDDVINIRNSNNIKLFNLHMKHKIPPNRNESLMLSCRNSRNLFIHNCYFEGAGRTGIYLENVSNADIHRCYFANNTNHSIEIESSENINFFNCYIYDNKTDNSIVYITSSSVRFGECHISNNTIENQNPAHCPIIKFRTFDSRKSQKEEAVPAGRLEIFDLSFFDNEPLDYSYLGTYTYYHSQSLHNENHYFTNEDETVCFSSTDERNFIQYELYADETR